MTGTICKTDTRPLAEASLPYIREEERGKGPLYQESLSTPHPEDQLICQSLLSCCRFVGNELRFNNSVILIRVLEEMIVGGGK